MVRGGFNGGDWLGNGITSSTANANRNFALAVADNAQARHPLRRRHDAAAFLRASRSTRPRSS